MKRQSKYEGWRSWNVAALGKTEEASDDYQYDSSINNSRIDNDFRPWNRITLSGLNEVKPDPQDRYLNKNSEQSFSVKRDLIDAFERISLNDSPDLYSENVVSQRYRDHSFSVNLDSDNLFGQQRSYRNGEFHLQRRHTDSDVPMLINLNEETSPVQEIPVHTPKSFDELKEIDWQAYSNKLLKEEFDKNQFRRDRSFLSEFDTFN